MQGQWVNEQMPDFCREGRAQGNRSLRQAKAGLIVSIMRESIHLLSIFLTKNNETTMHWVASKNETVWRRVRLPCARPLYLILFQSRKT